MTCPNCDEDTIKKILFKVNSKGGYLCDTCGAVWFDGENLSVNTSHQIQSLTNNDEYEYTYIDIDEQDDEAKSIMYPKFK